MSHVKTVKQAGLAPTKSRLRGMLRTGTNGGLIFEQIPIGFKRNVAYIVGDSETGEVAVVDAGFKPDLILERVDRLGAIVKYILATHSHRDHMGAAAALKQATGAPLAAYKTVPGVDVPLSDGDKLQVGGVCIEVIHTPGHTWDSVCFLVGGQKLVTGDTLYVGGVPKAPSTSLSRPFYQSLHGRLMKLDDAVEVWPGHNVGIRPSSTIGEERRANPILQMDLKDFNARKWDRGERRWVVPRRRGSTYLAGR